MTLLGGQTAGRNSPGKCHNFLGAGENSRQNTAVMSSESSPYSPAVARARMLAIAVIFFLS